MILARNWPKSAESSWRSSFNISEISGFYVYGEIILQLVRQFQRNGLRNLLNIPLECWKLQRGFRMFVSNSQIQVTRDVDWL